MPRLNFIPSRHGFHFRNDFENYIGPITTYGRCGGMAMAALDYYSHGLPVPTHRPDDFGPGQSVPPHWSRLSNYIYDRLLATLSPAHDWGFLHFVTADTNLDNHYAWSVNDEFPRVKNKIDAGHPFVLGLRPRVSDLAQGHQVVAYGYDESPKRVYVYDNNYPDEEVVLRADEANRRLLHTRADGTPTGSYEAYASYFVHDVFFPDVNPPYVDLGLQEGLVVRPQSNPPRVGERLEIEFVVRNFGDYPARLQELFVYVRDPSGLNRDDLLGGGDHDPSPIPPGGERRIRRVSSRFGEAAGSYRIGVSYLSAENHWIPVPAVAGGTRQEITLEVQPAVASPPRPNWYSLGGILISPLAVGSNLDGRLEVFGRGGDSKMWHLYQQTPNAPRDYSGWELLPGEQTFRGPASVVRNNWGKLEIFARGRDNAIWHRWQNDPNVRSGSQWSSWSSLGGSLATDPAAGLNWDQRIEVFAIGFDGVVHHAYQRFFAFGGAPWSGWEPLHGRAFKGRVAVGNDAEGKMVILARSTDDTLWQNYQLTRGGAWSGWLPFDGIGAGDPALARNSDGRLEAFVRGTDNRVWHKWQTAPNSGWSGWQPLNETSNPQAYLTGEGRIAVITNQQGRLEVLGRIGTNEIMSMHQTETWPWWSNWTSVGVNMSEDPVLGTDPDGTVEVFALGAGRELMHHWFTR